jgi:hypothetical protein
MHLASSLIRVWVISSPPPDGSAVENLSVVLNWVTMTNQSNCCQRLELADNKTQVLSLLILSLYHVNTGITKSYLYIINV